MSWIPSYKKPNDGGYAPPNWSTSTDEEIVAALEKHYAGEINLYDYWSVGDERIVHLDAMSAVSVGESHIAQDIVFVLTHIGGKTLSDGITECVFQVDQKDCLEEEGHMNSANSGGWKNSTRRTWCNNTYRNAIPSTLRPVFKEFICKSGTGNSTSNASEDTTDYFALRAGDAIGLGSSYSEAGRTYSTAYPLDGTISYYTDSSNDSKKEGMNGLITTNGYWLRSPINREYYNKKYTATNGIFTYANYSNNGTVSLSGIGATYYKGIAPFGVI